MLVCWNWNLIDSCCRINPSFSSYFQQHFLHERTHFKLLHCRLCCKNGLILCQTHTELSALIMVNHVITRLGSSGSASTFSTINHVKFHFLDWGFTPGNIKTRAGNPPDVHQDEDAGGAAPGLSETHRGVEGESMRQGGTLHDAPDWCKFSSSSGKQKGTLPSSSTPHETQIIDLLYTEISFEKGHLKSKPNHWFAIRKKPPTLYD